MKVTLTSFTPLPEELIIEAAATCWRSTPREEILDHILKAGHFTPLEFAVFNFRIEGVSRSLMAQLTRKRAGVGFAVESQRYKVDNTDFDYIVPSSIEQDDFTSTLFHYAIENIKGWYKTLLAYVPQEDARYILPNACETVISLTINYHALLDLAKERLCGKAQWEIRELVKQLKAEVAKVAPKLGEYLQPKCFWLKHCPEGKPCENYRGKVCKCKIDYEHANPVVTDDGEVE